MTIVKLEFQMYINETHKKVNVQYKCAIDLDEMDTSIIENFVHKLPLKLIRV